MLDRIYLDVKYTAPSYVHANATCRTYLLIVVDILLLLFFFLNSSVSIECACSKQLYLPWSVAQVNFTGGYSLI